MKKIASANRCPFRSLVAPLTRLSCCICFGFLLISCSTLPKETYLSKTCLTNLKKVAVFASVNDPEVSYAMHSLESSTWIFIFFGLIGSGIDAGVRSGIDKSHASQIKENVDLKHFEKQIANSFVKSLTDGNYFSSIVYFPDNQRDNNSLSTMGYNAVINVSVNEIKIHQTAGDYCDLNIQVSGKMRNLISGELIWDRIENVSASEKHTMNYYKENGLTELDTMLEKAGRNLAYDFLYLK
jgi:hypothetical protein